VWYGGGKLAADLTLPKLRTHWGRTSHEGLGRVLSAPAARAVIRNVATGAAQQARGEPDFFARLRQDGLTVRLRFSEIHPGEVTGYAVALPGHDDGQGRPLWYSGGRLSADLTLPRLRRRWRTGQPGSAERSGAGAPQRGTLRRRRAPARNVLVHRRGTGRDLRTRRPPGRRGCGAHPALRGTRSGPSRRRRVGGRRHAARRGADDRQPGAAPRRRRLRPRRPRTLRPHPMPHRRRRRAPHRSPRHRTDRQDQRRQAACDRRAGRQPVRLGGGGRRAASCPATRRAGSGSPGRGRGTARCRDRCPVAGTYCPPG
jgi:hypothetical protein